MTAKQAQIKFMMWFFFQKCIKNLSKNQKHDADLKNFLVHYLVRELKSRSELKQQIQRNVLSYATGGYQTAF